MTRNYKFDTLKFMLIFLVVFGHLLELWKGGTVSDSLYRIIYSFHMPAFILHGFIVKALTLTNVFQFGDIANILLAFVMSLLIVIMLGNEYVARIFNTCCTGDWILKLNSKIRKG